MIRTSKRLVRKKIPLRFHHLDTRRINALPHPFTRCGYTIVERLAMPKCKASEHMPRQQMKSNTSADVAYYQPAVHPIIRNESATTIGKWPIYLFFIDSDRKYFPLRCMLYIESTFFVISPEAAKAFSTLVVK
jgi:hypothetical protein